MLPRGAASWPKLHRRSSAESLQSAHSVHSNTSIEAFQSDVSVSEDGIVHSPEFLDDRLPPEYFRQDVIRLIHQLRTPGWSMVHLDMAPDLEMHRISGALTNSVYSVKPPKYIKEQVKREYAGRPYQNKMPQSLLLRVYGPQVGILIDRKKELETVAVLTKYNIGPRLLGTFTNGRFEQFLNAKPLTKEDLRQPEISVLIAKRMRDLHENVPLSDEDREHGCLIWQDLEKWSPAAADQVEKLERRQPGTRQRVLHRPSFGEFLDACAKYRAYLEEKYGTIPIVFCHNDTQYGNILRLEPPKGSPLLRPQNEHRQLVVIDFEYSGPNARAYDIANHFCEWMGDYHHPTMPHHVWVERYPNEEEQLRFITSYVEHGSPDFNEEVMDAEIKSLMEQTRDWRPAVSASWALWGIIQTPQEVDSELRQNMLEQNPSYEILSKSPDEVQATTEEEDMFDYLSYSSEKLALFWNDLKELGIVN